MTGNEKIDQLFATGEKANASLAFSLLVSSEKLSVWKAIKLIVNHFLGREDSSGTKQDPFIDFDFLGVRILYFYSKHNEKPPQLCYECFVDNNLEYAGIVTDVENNDYDNWWGYCVDHFNQNIYQYVYLIEKQLEKA